MRGLPAIGRNEVLVVDTRERTVGLSTLGSLEEREVLSHAAERLARFKLPKRVVLVEDGPTLTHGEMRFGAGTSNVMPSGHATTIGWLRPSDRSRSLPLRAAR